MVFDLVIRNGRILDGTGRSAIDADIGIIGNTIAAVGPALAAGQIEIDAQDKIVTPGFVDIHTHYDGHVTWAERLNPSSSHGVTTVVMGNCGVGFAPCKPQDRDDLVDLMEGVEDIPEVVMTAGLPWSWQNFPEYLDVLAGRRFDMDVAAQLPHAPLRMFVMGERASQREPATAQDIAAMRAIATEAIRAGALGFSTSRSINHKSTDGKVTPSYAAAADELAGIALGLKDAGAGVLQLISDFDDVGIEFDIIRRMARESGRPLSLSLFQVPRKPNLWREILDLIEAANSDGLEIKAQVAGRPIGALYGLALSRHPFFLCPAYLEIADLPVAARAAAMRDPERRKRILDEHPGDSDFGNHFPIGDSPVYEPAPEDSVVGLAARLGVTPAELSYDLLSADDGGAVFYSPVTNYVGYSNAAIRTMLTHENTILGLGDGGAHCGVICDASMTSYMMARWAQGDDAMPIETVVKALTSDTARAVGLKDRGVIAPGFKADINVIDLDRLTLGRPAMVYDLPQGGGRLGQGATGYEATIVSGEITYREGVATGALPGRLVRGGGAVSAGPAT